MVPRYNNSSGTATKWRNTPTADRQIKKKLCDLEQKESYKRLRVNIMNKLAKTIKESKSFVNIEDLHRIGEFFKGLELAGKVKHARLFNNLFRRCSGGSGARRVNKREADKLICHRYFVCSFGT